MNLIDGPALVESVDTVLDPIRMLCNSPGRESSRVKSAPLADPVDIVCMLPLVETVRSVAGSIGRAWEES